MVGAVHAIPLGVIALGLTAATAWAALPPYWQSAREIQAILDDARVHDALKYQEPILSIETTGDDVYVLSTERCRVTITIVDKPQAEAIVGPRQFDLEVGEAQCE
jgi:hypothetical protein